MKQIFYINHSPDSPTAAHDEEEKEEDETRGTIRDIDPDSEEHLVLIEFD